MDIKFTKLPIYSYDYNKIETFCLSKREELINDNIGLILGVLRGGGVSALIISQMLSLPVDFYITIKINLRKKIKTIAKKRFRLDSVDDCN